MLRTADSRPPVLCIMGPTASGKTDIAVKLVQRLPFDIISVDSGLVYRSMDIGTAKPDAATLRVAPHRLIDLLDPTEAYSAARFRTDALREIKKIQAAGRIPLLVGGTMLYFRALQQGLSELPAADPGVRARLEAERKKWGLAALHARLAAVDPAAAERIHPRDTQRVQRALEVFEVTGQAMTELYAHRGKPKELFRTLNLVLAPAERHILHQRIEQRFYDMLENGFVAEVEQLRARGDLGLDKPSMRAVGYRQVWEYLDGMTDYAGMTLQGMAATRQFAKRQLTWLRAESDTFWFDSLMPQVLAHIINYLRVARFFPKSI